MTVVRSVRSLVPTGHARVDVLGLLHEGDGLGHLLHGGTTGNGSCRHGFASDPAVPHGRCVCVHMACPRRRLGRGAQIRPYRTRSALATAGTGHREPVRRNISAALVTAPLLAARFTTQPRPALLAGAPVRCCSPRVVTRPGRAAGAKADAAAARESATIFESMMAIVLPKSSEKQETPHTLVRGKKWLDAAPPPSSFFSDPTPWQRSGGRRGWRGDREVAGQRKKRERGRGIFARRGCAQRRVHVVLDLVRLPLLVYRSGGEK